jgi:putative tryptophan/tyrosine transport system substrate-binding protein
MIESPPPLTMLLSRHTRRREFIATLGGAAASLGGANAQQLGQIRRVGVLMSYLQTDNEAQQWRIAFSQSFKELGWIDGVNVRVDYRWSGPTPDHLQADAAELIGLSPDVLLAGATAAVIALKNETEDIPIIFANVADPMGQGFVASLAQPGGNITGFGAFEFSIAGKWVQAFKQIVPSAVTVGVIVNPETAPFYKLFLPFIDTAAHLAGITPSLTTIHQAGEIAGAIDKLGNELNAGLIVLRGALFTTARETIVDAAARLRLPAVYPYSFYARSGGLISYGFEIKDMFGRAARYVDLALRGAKPADLPVQQPTKFELIVNLKTAQALGVTIPASLLAQANEVIE